MKLDIVLLKNYRLIREARINLHTDGGAAVLVGPNNSGKTTVAEALRTFIGASARAFSFDDFWGGTHTAFAAFGAAALAETPLPDLPVLRTRIQLF